MPDENTKWIVVTDLDGTLLNHDSYDYDAALLAIETLKNENIPVVLNTSKTFLETVSIREELAINDPFIVENGSCIYLLKSEFKQPEGASSRGEYWEIILGASQSSIDQIFCSLEINDSQYTRLSQCSILEVINLTGLTEEQAKEAVARDFSEPFLWHEDEQSLNKLINNLQEYNLSVLQGGRFLHVIGNCDKGRATKRLASCYEGTVKTIALGDSANDAAMLKAANISIIVNSPSSKQLDQLVSADYQTEATAPEGWKEGIEMALLQINKQ
jgi:mannosyl-3-phosphoglycerate phosphatase